MKTIYIWSLIVAIPLFGSMADYRKTKKINLLHTSEVVQDTINDIINSNSVNIQDSSLVYSLIYVESTGNDSCVGDRHLVIPSIGCLQIRPIMVREVNRILKDLGNTTRFKNKDRWSRKKSIQMFYIWKNFHHKESTNEKIARNWNGGPRGYKRKRTLQYWEKVQKKLNKQL